MNTAVLHMNEQVRKRTRWLQICVWVIFYVFLLLYTIQKWEFPRFGFWAATIATVSYFIAVYCHAHWLIPGYFKKNKRAAYFLLAILVLVILQLGRMYAEYKILFPLHLKFYSWTLSHFSFVFITNFLAFAFGALLRVSIDHFVLLHNQQELKTRQLASELNLLKAQVQPHFLFNTLNNIYYLAYTKNERTAEVIARLSEIMRYFVDEAPRERLPLGTEINFIKNYIELEQIRMLHPVKIEFNVNADPSLLVPPMLMIPLVENIFKHGIDKTKEMNDVVVVLRQDEDELVFTTSNTICAIDSHPPGSGLRNLRKRLEFLYGDDFVLQTRVSENIFRTELKFPV